MTDYTAANYNPYMYQNSGYYPFSSYQNRGGGHTENTLDVVITSQPDTFTSSSTNNNQVQGQKNGLSKNAKFGLGALSLVGIGVAAYLATRGKAGSKSVQQLAEYIEFKPAKTVEEAIEFGKTHLGIKKYKGFEAKDIDVINWINEGFVNVNNKVKGKLQVPKTIKYAEYNDGTLQAVDRFKHIYLVDKRTYEHIDEEIQKKLKDLLADRKADGIITLPKAESADEHFKAFISNIKNYNVALKKKTPISFKEKVKLYQNLDEYVYSLGNHTYEPVSAFGTIYHECWHLMDSKLLTRSKSSSSIDQAIARKVSYYAKDSEAEYIAEVGRRYMEGHTLVNEALELYKKLGGPALS